MNYVNPRIAAVADQLKISFDQLEDKTSLLKATELKALYAEIPTLPPDERANFGKEINQLKAELEQLVAE